MIGKDVFYETSEIKITTINGTNYSKNSLIVASKSNLNYFSWSFEFFHSLI